MPDDMFDTMDLHNIPLFSSLTPKVLRQLMQTMKAVNMPPGEIVCREGEPGDSLFIILEGKVEIIRGYGTPHEHVLNHAGPGSFIGEMSLFDPEGVRTASVRTLTDMLVLVMTREDFEKLIHTQPELAFEISRVLSLRIRDANLDLENKNYELEQALVQLKAAQAELVEKEKMERELELARTIQQNILPKESPSCNGFLISGRMEAARYVGGDFYDFLILDDRHISVVIGDVSDKGVPAAIFMALTRALIRSVATPDMPPSEVLTRVNRLLGEMSDAPMFVTVLYGILDTRAGTFSYARAGHELPLLVDETCRPIHPVKDQGQPLALVSNPVFDCQVIGMPPGSTLLLYTDGATDITSEQGEFFSMERLKQALANFAGEGPDILCSRLIKAIRTHQGAAAQYDDLTLVAIQAAP